MSILRNTDKAGRLTHESCATYLHVCMFSPMSFSHFFNFSIFQFFNFSILHFFILSLLFISCQDHGTAIVDESIPRDSMPLLRSYGVSTLISDSGILRYKIIAEDWFVYDRTNPPRWTFPKGLFLQKFDAQFHTDAYISCDTAFYYGQQRLWELRGRVVVKNPKGETFKTSLLYWDMNARLIHSPAYMKIDGIEQDLDGYDFRSNEQLTDYLIHSSSGAFPMGEEHINPVPAEPDSLVMFSL